MEASGWFLVFSGCKPSRCSVQRSQQIRRVVIHTADLFPVSPSGGEGDVLLIVPPGPRSGLSGTSSRFLMRFSGLISSVQATPLTASGPGSERLQICER